MATPSAKKTAKRVVNKARKTSKTAVAKKGFFEDVTFKHVVWAIATLVLAVALMMTMINNPLNHLRVSNESLDIQARRDVILAQEKTKQEQEKTKQAEISTGRIASIGITSARSISPSVASTSVQSGCEVIARNGSYIVPEGRCITLDNTSGGLQSHAYSTYINVSRPVTEVSGGDFVAIGLSKAVPHEQCDSRESEDRCKKWIADHIHQWNGLYVARFRVMEGQKITIKTST